MTFGTRATAQRVVAAEAREDVGAVVAGDRVVERRAVRVLDADQRVGAAEAVGGTPVGRLTVTPVGSVE